MPRVASVKRIPRKGAYAQGLLDVEALRRQIPAALINELLLQGALTGQIPTVDRITGKPDGNFTTLTDNRRQDLLQYMFDKAVPNKTPVERLLELDEPEGQDLELTPEAMQSLSNEQLSGLLGSTAQGQITDATYRPISADDV